MLVLLHGLNFTAFALKNWCALGDSGSKVLAQPRVDDSFDSRLDGRYQFAGRVRAPGIVNVGLELASRSVPEGGSYQSLDVHLLRKRQCVFHVVARYSGSVNPDKVAKTPVLISRPSDQ